MQGEAVEAAQMVDAAEASEAVAEAATYTSEEAAL
jgi:hypothetical protein